MYIEEHEKYIEVVDPLFSHISQGRIIGYTSFKVLTKPMEEKDKKLVCKYEDLLTNSKGLILTDMDKNIAVESAKLRVKYW
ncbi:MAG: hypothetical protein UZ01_01392 [Candidatus Brocadia sinica]|nr:MAG: hypothetical protein UZ01_01392 [Candidatus Brocadia sinica]